MTTTELSMKDVKKGFHQGNSCLEVLQGVTVTFTQGKTYAITGVSGTGKSTLLHLLAGIDTPTSGDVYFNKKNLSTLSPAQKDQFLNKSIGLVFQLPYLIRELSVLENIMMPGLIAKKNEDVCKKKALSLLKTLGLEEKAEQLPASLSGGQQQRVAIARAVFNKPDFLLADEPTGNLDIITGKQIIDLLCSYQKEWNMGLIVISHAAYVADKMDEKYELENGRLKKK